LQSLSYYAMTAIELITTPCATCKSLTSSKTAKFSISQFGYCPTCLEMQLWYQEATGGYFF
jgi:late competence protein required for DNA uptake (superfamily II DNA/RNA helicase)